jgi:hypothetical protein
MIETAKKVKLELVGLDGNAFSVMGAFQRAARQQGWKPDEIKAVLDEAMTGDYDHLLATIIEHTESPPTDPDAEPEYDCEDCCDEGCENCQ